MVPPRVRCRYSAEPQVAVWTLAARRIATRGPTSSLAGTDSRSASVRPSRAECRRSETRDSAADVRRLAGVGPLESGRYSRGDVEGQETLSESRVASDQRQLPDGDTVRPKPLDLALLDVRDDAERRACAAVAARLFEHAVEAIKGAAPVAVRLHDEVANVISVLEPLWPPHDPDGPGSREPFDSLSDGAPSAVVIVEGDDDVSPFEPTGPLLLERPDAWEPDRDSRPVRLVERVGERDHVPLPLAEIDCLSAVRPARPC